MPVPDFTPDNTPPVAIALPSLAGTGDDATPVTPGAFTPDNTSPVAIAPGAFAGTAGAPVAVDPGTFTPDGGAPVAADPGSFTPDNTAPEAKALAGLTPDNTAPDAKDPGDHTPSNTAAVPIGAGGLASDMPSTFTPAFTELTGGGNCLDSLQPTTADIGKVLQGTVNGELKSYQVRAGTAATDLPGIVRPANFDAEENAVVFYQV